MYNSGELFDSTGDGSIFFITLIYYFLKEGGQHFIISINNACLEKRGYFCGYVCWV
jgi:hypothetical protein